MGFFDVVALVALVVALLALAVAVIGLRKEAPQLRAASSTREPEVARLPDERPTGPAAFVINPVKVGDVDALEEAARTISQELGLEAPLLYRTTVEDPGIGQARDAVEHGASVVVAAGGDGTVRAVATALAGGTVPMALVPVGTGNLLARNLDLPIEGTRALVRTALSGRDIPIDLGWVVPLRAPSEPGLLDPPEAVPDLLARQEEHLFLVMAGVGFDAAMVADTGDALKARVGWAAYFVSGVKHLRGRTRLTMRVGSGAWQHLRVRTLLFANCGRLPAGIVLLPDAAVDDGYLDIAAINTKGGLIGWASLLWTVVLQGFGVNRQYGYAPSSIEFSRGRTIEVELESPGPIQVDGDLLGDAVGLRVRVAPGDLWVRVRS